VSSEPPTQPNRIRRALTRFPEDCREALYFDLLSNIGNGVHLVLFPIALVVLETLLDGEVWHQAVLASFFFGSCLFGLLVTRLGNTIPMRIMVIVPNSIIAVLLCGTLGSWVDATWFTILIGITFMLRVFQQVAEMNMFRVLYPDSHRSQVVGVLRAVSAISGLTVTITSWWWFGLWPAYYAVLFCIMGSMLLSSAWFYAKVPIPKDASYERDQEPLWQSFKTGWRVFFADKSFVRFQVGFAMAGIANHIGLFLIPKVMRQEAGASDSTVRFVAAVMPVLLLVMTAPIWGRLLDRKTPMFARGVFNVLQIVAFIFYGYGGLSLQVWPFIVGGAVHALSNGGGTINWLTGSLYFAKPEHVSLYNGIHVFLTGFRGFIGPPLAMFLFIATDKIGDMEIEGLGMGARVFYVSAVLSAMGAVMMFWQDHSAKSKSET
jgi:MFS family permease